VFSTFQSRGLPRVGLGVDAESTTGAVRLYENAGMTVAERNDIWERRA
jgi:ribosomal protein S18 acetylase RimI-like enzyme